MKNIVRGFSLIELMIVIAIIGILAAIGIPAYGDYLIRSKVTDVVNSATAAKLGMAEYRMVNGTFADVAAAADWNGVYSLGDPADTSDKVAAAFVNGSTDSLAYLHMCSDPASGTGLGLPAGNTLNIVFKAESTTGGGIKWTCMYSGSDGTSAAGVSKYAPASCRTLSDAAADPC